LKFVKNYEVLTQAAGYVFIQTKLFYFEKRVNKMALHLINVEESGTDEAELSRFCDEFKLDLTVEYKGGQYWLHSDVERERPISIEIDQELHRHEEYFKRSSIHKELVARAIGIKGPFRPRVLDLSAGLLGDTLLFLALGCEVLALERHPLVSLLIKKALLNAKHPALAKLTFINEDAGHFLESKPQVDTIYFDPMFEDANGKSAPRKEMRIFRHFIGSDHDAKSVFEKAKRLGAKRLVVKRPKHSIALTSEEAVTFLGKATRYDVYLGVR